MKGKGTVIDIEQAWTAITPVPEDKNGDYFKYVPHPASLEFLSEAKGSTPPMLTVAPGKR